MTPPDHIRRNREAWDRTSAKYQSDHAEQLDRKRFAWGVWGLPESEIAVLPDLAGQRVLEFGCGGAQWSIFLAQLHSDARTELIGLDLSFNQLAHARGLANAAEVNVPLVNANAEETPFAEASFDVVFCDHGAMSFADPRLSVPEASRILRPGGWFIFNMASPIHDLFWNRPEDPVGETLARPYFELGAQDEGDMIGFQLPYGEWIRLFHASGFAVEDLIELRPGADAKTTFGDYVSLDWAQRWPAENIWKLRKE